MVEYGERFIPVLAYPKWLVATARAAALVGLVPAALVYDYVVWRLSYYAWGMGLHFYASPIFAADALWYIIHCLFLAVALFLFPHFAGLGLPRLAGARRPLLVYGAVVALSGLAALVNHRFVFFTNPFAGRGPLFFTLGPLAWEVMWSGFLFGFAAALLGPRAEGHGGDVMVGVLALGGVVWYTPVINWLSKFDAAGFVLVTLVINTLSLTLRRRTGSIWAGLAGHLLVKFILTW